MSLTGIDLGVIDTLDILIKDKTTHQTLYTGITTKAGISDKTTAIDIWGGISQKHLAKLFSKKDITVTGSIIALDMNFLASLNGVPLINDQTGSIYFTESNPITGTSAVITGATEIFSIQRITGEFLSLQTTPPLLPNEVQISYPAGTSGTQQVDTLTVNAAPTTAGSITVTLNNGTAVSKTVALLSTDTITSTATKIATAFVGTTGFTITSSGANVIFTANLPAINTPTTVVLTDIGTTGATGTSVATTPGIAPSTTNATATFYTGFADKTALFTYVAPPVTGKDNLKININANTFPKNAEVILRGVCYDYNTEDIVADIKVRFYKVSIDPDFTLAFDMGKAIETPISLSVLTSKTLPQLINNELVEILNTEDALGFFEVTER